MPRGCILSVPSISLHSSYVHALKLVLKNKNKNQGTSNKEGAMARTFATLYEETLDAPKGRESSDLR